MTMKAFKFVEIERARDVLYTARTLFRDLQRTHDRTITGRFYSAIDEVAQQAMNSANKELYVASQKARSGNGLAEVSASTMEVVRQFRRIGPARLQKLLYGNKD